MRHSQGFSLLELLCCMAIIGICSAIAIPRLDRLIESERARSATNIMLGAVQFARGQAVYQRRVVSLCSGDSACIPSANWQHVLLVFSDPNLNGNLDAGEELLRSIELPNKALWQWNGFRSDHYVQFNPDGTTRALNGTFTLCIDHAPINQIVINLSGRSRRQAIKQPADCN